MEEDFKKLGGLALVLLTLMIIVGVIFLVSSNFKSNICTQELSTNTYSNGVCSLANGTAVTISALTQVSIVETSIILLLSFVGLLVIVGVAKIILKMVKGF